MRRVQNEMIVRLARALRSARRVVKDVRDSEWESYTIPPDRSFKHMSDDERSIIRRYDRLLAKINAALQ